MSGGEKVATVEGPLHGIRVVDLSHFAAGPVASLVLADLGAEVIKVEHPKGDPCRHLGITFPSGWSTFFLALNRNKRFISVDYGTEAGQNVIRDLVARADVVLENARPGTWRRYGLDYETLAQLNPRLVYGSISGFGRTGPMAGWLGMDPIAQAVGGLMGITGSDEGGPAKVGAAIADVISGRFLALGIVTALFDRVRTGRGQLVETSLFATIVSMLAMREVEFQFTGQNPSLLGTAHGQIVPAQAFETKDHRHVMLCCYGDDHFRRWATLAEHPEVLDDIRFATAPSRVKNASATIGAVQSIMLERTESEWTERLAGHVPYGPILLFDQLWEHPQLESEQLLMPFTMPGLGEIRTVGSPVRLSSYEPSVRHVPGPIGADTWAILREQGMSRDAIQRLLDQGAVTSSESPRDDPLAAADSDSPSNDVLEAL